MSQFEVLSKDSCAQAGWFCKGVVRKNSQACLLKTKEMIMPGIMSEGSAAESVPRYAECCGSRSRHRGEPDRPQLAAGLRHWHRTRARIDTSCFARSTGPAHAAH